MKTTTISLVRTSPSEGNASYSVSESVLPIGGSIECMTIRPSRGDARPLVKALQTLCIVINELHSEHDIHSCVLIRRRNGAIDFTGVDDSLQVRKSVYGGPCGEDFSVAVDAEKLLSALLLAAADEVAVECEDGQLYIRGDEFSFSFHTRPASEFPAVPPVFSTQATILTLSLELVKGLLDQTKHAMASDDFRTQINGILIATQGQHLTLAATDSKRLAYVRADTARALPSLQFIVPYLAVHELDRHLRTATDPETRVELRIADGRACFTVNGFELVTNLVPGSYPDIERIISESWDTEVNVNRHALVLAIQRAAFANADCWTTLSLSAGRLSVTSAHQTTCSAAATVSVEYEGQQRQVTFRSSDLLEALNSMPGANAAVQFHQEKPFLRLCAIGTSAAQHVFVGRYPG